MAANDVATAIATSALCLGFMMPSSMFVSRHVNGYVPFSVALTTVLHERLMQLQVVPHRHHHGPLRGGLYFNRPLIFCSPAMAQASSFSLPLAPPTPIAPITSS